MTSFSARHIFRAAMSAALLAALAGCTSAGGVAQPSAPETVTPEKALALPPPGGPTVLSVVETRHSNGIEQTIALFTSSSVSGQNFLKIHFFGAPGAGAGPEAAVYRRLNETQIIREAFRAVPGVAMVRSGAVLQNNYGPFAYASGRSATGDTCIYAWQQIRSPQSAQGGARNLGMIQVRLRLCDARASERQLLGVFYGYTITATLLGEVWNPYGKAPSANPALGATGNPIYPDENQYRDYKMPIGYEPAAAPTTVRAVRAPVAPTVKRATSPQPAPLPAPVGPKVPLPDVGADAPPASVPVQNRTSPAPPGNAATMPVPGAANEGQGQ